LATFHQRIRRQAQRLHGAGLVANVVNPARLKLALMELAPVEDATDAPVTTP
jgi:hypothetical protein